MSEYWVSQAKYYCKYCNNWMADNKPSRDHHNSSIRHKRNIEEFNKKKREDRLHGSRSENELKKQLAEINKAAREAIAVDREELGDQFYRQPVSQKPRSLLGPHAKIGDGDEEERDNKNGLYTIRGQSYLEGQLNEQYLLTGTTCQIFVEDKDEWFDAIILARKEINVHHTTVVVRLYTIQYIVSGDDDDDNDDDSNDNGNEEDDVATTTTVKVEGNTEVTKHGSNEAGSDDNNDDKDNGIGDNDMSGPQLVVLENIKSDKLRLLADDDGRPVHLDGTPLYTGATGGPAPSSSSAAASDRDPSKNTTSKPVKTTAVEKNASTGVSGWTTVAVAMVDEEEEERLRMIAEIKAQLEAESEKEKSHLQKESERNALLAQESGDVMSVCDPYGKNVYRGVELTTVHYDDGFVNVNNAGSVVSFKKRKSDLVQEEASGQPIGATNTSVDGELAAPVAKPPKNRNIRKRTFGDEDD